MNDLRDRVTAVLAAHAPDTAGPKDIAVAVCYRLAFATFMDFATSTHFPGQAHEMSWTTLIDHVAMACTSYLFDASDP